jgi:pyrroloquinoline quinone biosynthesis protein B
MTIALLAIADAGARGPAPDGGPEVIVLGIAQDGGHPQAGCTKACCRDAWDDPSRGHRVASLAVVDDGQAWIVDATPDFPHQLHALGDVELAGILLTHAHMGHYTGLLELGREAMGADHVPVHALPRMKAMLEQQEPWALLVRLGHIVPTAAVAGEPVALGARVTATPFLVPHRDELSETVGWTIRGPHTTVVWLPDIDKWERWDTPLETLLAGTDVAYVDGTFFADGELGRDMSSIPHPFVSETMARLKPTDAATRAKVRFVHLNHTNPALDPKSDASRAIREAGMAVAVEGERVRL